MKVAQKILSVFGLILFCGCSDPASKVDQAITTGATNAPSTQSTAGSREYVISPTDSKIEFVGSKVTGSHTGGFTNFQGAVKVAEGKVVGTPVIRIDMNSTWSDNERLTGHLRSPDFFHVEKFTNSVFTLTKFEGEGENVTIHGNLELHGVTKGISFPAKVKLVGDTAHVTAEFAINRKEFGIVYPGKSDDLIRDNVIIRFDLKALPAKA